MKQTGSRSFGFWFWNVYVPICVGLARTIYIRCTNDIFGLELTINTVYMYVYIRFWPILNMCHVTAAPRPLSKSNVNKLKFKCTKRTLERPLSSGVPYSQITVRPWIHPPPLTIKNLFGQNVHPPPPIHNLQFCLAAAPPMLELPDGCRWGWGWGWGCRGRGRRSWSWGVRECREGESENSDHSSKGLLTTHCSHCSKSLISATALPSTPLEINIDLSTALSPHPPNNNK